MSNTCAPTVTTGPFCVGEKPAPLEYQFLDSTGAPLNITGYTAKFVFKEIYGAETTANATVTDGPAGKVTYTWGGTEFPIPGDYRAHFWVGNGTNRFASLLIQYTVSNCGTVPAI